MAGTPRSGANHGELDRLIGQLEDEAARRRAEPGFPLDAEARLRRQLDEMAPGRRPSPDALIKSLLEIVDAGATRPAPPSRRRHDRAAFADLLARQIELAGRLDRLATGVAVAMRVVFDALAARPPLGAVAVTPDSAGGAQPGGFAPPATSPTCLLATWVSDLAGRTRGEGPVLCGGRDLGDLVARLRSGGCDATDIGADVPVITGELASLPPARPGVNVSVVLVGLMFGDACQLGELTGQLERVATGVEAVSVAPWSWRSGVGPLEADLSTLRPVCAETLIESLSEAGFEVTAAYDRCGQSYEVVAVRP